MQVICREKKEYVLALNCTAPNHLRLNTHPLRLLCSSILFPFLFLFLFSIPSSSLSLPSLHLPRSTFAFSYPPSYFSSNSLSFNLPSPMDFSFHSQHFDRVQISDQDFKPGPLSQPEAPPQFSVPDWARWRSQLGPMPHYYQDLSIPRLADGEPYSLGPLSQDLIGDPNGYLDSYRSPVTPTMAGTPLGMLAPQAGESHPDWSLFQPSHVFKDQPYSYPQIDHLQPPPDSPLSPFSEVSSYHSPQSLAASSPAMTVQTADRLSPRSGTGDNREERPGHPPYSVLIYQALKDAPGNKLQLQSIYSWFEANTGKARDPKAKGWQNSIRHNLSMNAVTLTFHNPFFQFIVAIYLVQRLLY